MSFVFASSHLPEDNRPEQEDEEEDQQLQPMQRSGMVRAFSHPPQRGQGEPAAPRPLGPSARAHLPAWITEPPETAPKPKDQANPDSPGDFAPPVTTGGDTHGTIGPSSPRGAAPPAGRSLFLTPRPMPPGYARRLATTYGAGPGNRGNASSYGYADNAGSGGQPVATGASTRPMNIPEFLAHGRIAQEEARKKWDKLRNPEAAAEPTVEMLEQKERQLEAEANGARQALHNQLEIIKKRGELRLVVEGAKRAQDKGKEGLPKGMEVPFDFGMDHLGISPDKVIEKIDADIAKRQNDLLKYWEDLEKANMALQQAKMETAAAKKKELAKKQKKPPVQPPEKPRAPLPAEPMKFEGPGVAL